MPASIRLSTGRLIRYAAMHSLCTPCKINFESPVISHILGQNEPHVALILRPVGRVGNLSTKQRNTI